MVIIIKNKVNPLRKKEKITKKILLKFILLKEGKDTGITFRAVPSGHEFTSLLRAVLNADGKGKNFPDEFITRCV